MEIYMIYKNRKINFFVIYTLCFLILAFILSFFFFIWNKSFIWSIDGMAQHVVALKYIRNYILNFFNTGQLPMIDYTVGQGFDVIGTLNYYGFGDPITLLTVFFPEKSLETMYQFLILLRMFFCGLSFAYFCKTIDKNRFECVLPASLLYAFSNFALFGGIRHPLFLNGIMYFPLLLAGIEKIIQKKKIGFLTIIVALSFSTNYYFMFINTIIAIIYFFVRQSGHYRENGIRSFFVSVMKIGASYIWGIGISAIIFLPALMSFFNNSRGSSINNTPDSLYDMEYYNKYISSFFISYNELNKWAIPGIGVLGVLALLIVLIRWKKEERKLLVGFLILFLMMCIPWVGKIMNGMSYTTNRFSYTMSFLLSLLLVFAIQDIKEFTKKKFIILGISTFVACSICFIAKSSNQSLLIYLVAFVLIALSLITTYAYFVCSNKRYTIIISYAFTGIALINLTFNFITIFNYRFGGYSSTFSTRGSVERVLNNSTLEALKNISDNSFFRTEREVDMKNTATFNNVKGTTYYYSIIPNHMSTLYDKTGLSNLHKIYVLEELEQRPGLLSLACVKYYVGYKKNDKPYGFELISERKNKNGKTVYLFENNNFLPLGITYSSYMTKKQFYNLDVIEREQALLTAAVVDEKKEEIKNYTSAINGIYTEKPTINGNKFVTVKDGMIQSKEKKSIRLEFNGRENCNYFLVFEDMKAKDSSRKKINFSFLERKGKMKVLGTKRGDYFSREAMIINAGYSKEKCNKLTISFPKKRKYKYKKMYMTYISMDEYVKRIHKLKEDVLENIKIKPNKITGDIKCRKNEILQLSIPYSKGYSVYVDEKKVETFSSGIAYLGINLKKGNHRIVIKYFSPGLKSGIILTLISSLLYILYLFYIPKKETVISRLVKQL